MTFVSVINIEAKTNYIDLVLTENLICALTDTEKLQFFDNKTGQIINLKLDINYGIKIISTDHFGKLVVVDKDNNIRRLQLETRTFEFIAKVKQNLYYILFDSKNDCYAITEKGILNLKTNKIYFSNNSFNHQIIFEDKWEKPYCYFIDRSDIIWLGYGYGEWGGNIFTFETITNKFISPNLESFNIALWPIKSFFEDDSCTYLSSGLQHMRTRSIIIKFKNLKATALFETEFKRMQLSGNGSFEELFEAEYIGPSAYNKYNKSIYFYSQNGIFKGELNKDLSKIENWSNIIKPKLHWSQGQPDAVGSPMNVFKLAIIDRDRFLFLTQHDGIGFYDGQNLQMIDL
jgi:hypothetical protein